jgi:quercetin dioxygenase-like cupin family protein
MGPAEHGCVTADLLDEGSIPPSGILSRTLHDDAGVRTVLFGFAEGEEMSEHTSSRPAVIQVLSGGFDLTLGEERLDGRAGTWVHMPAGTPHALRARRPSLMLLTLLEAPARSAAR